MRPCWVNALTIINNYYDPKLLYVYYSIYVYV